ncbi:MAG: DUF2203 domain-containing protein, partial [Anaerolineales bacterium]
PARSGGVRMSTPELEPVMQQVLNNGGNKAASQASLYFEQMREIVDHIQDSGAEVKDVNSGLLDFRSHREGREVYLCWRYGEDEIQYWHDLDAGFAGRQPL